MANPELIREEGIIVSSNQKSVNMIRPGHSGWQSDMTDHQRTVTIKVGHYLQSGGNIRLLKAKNVISFDIILIGGKNKLAIEVCNNLFFIYTDFIYDNVMLYTHL